MVKLHRCLGRVGKFLIAKNNIRAYVGSLSGVGNLLFCEKIYGKMGEGYEYTLQTYKRKGGTFS